MESRTRLFAAQIRFNIFALILLVGLSVSYPASYDEYVSVQGDVATVGSLRREVRQPAPPGFAGEASDLLVAGNEPEKSNNKKVIKNSAGKSNKSGYYRTYGSDADGEKGYEKQIDSKGNHGYKTLDTFHKQNGDNYGFQKHTAFGHARGEDEGGQHGKSASYKSKDGDDHEGAGTYADSYYAEDEDDHAGYTEEDDGDGAESSHYTSGGEGGGGDGDGSYAHSEGYSENYSSDGGDDGSYGSHNAYSSDGGEGGDGGDYY